MKVSVIILSYNTRDLLDQCLQSVLIDSKVSYEVVVVDNNSADDSVKLIKTKYPQVKLYALDVNKGFAGGNNVAIREAKSDYVMLLNSDTVFEGDVLTPLVSYMDSHPQAGAITPRIELPDGSLDIACHRGMPTPWNSLAYFSGLEKLFPKTRTFGGYHQSFLDLNSVHSVPASAATAFIVRQKTIADIGMLDEDFFLYGEDLDWCKRMTDAGWEIIYYPGVTVKHYKSASGKKKKGNKKVKSASVDYFYDTMKLFYDKHYTKTYPKWLRQLVFLGIDYKKRTHR